ncbi:MAG: DMT family transporter [Halapricum sp.]
MNLGLGYAIASAFLFGGYLYVIKRYFSQYPSPVYVVLVEGLAFVWYLPFALLTVDGGYLPAGASPRLYGVILGVSAMTGLALLSFLEALQRGAVSYVAPISKIVPVFVLPLEILLLGQHLTTLQIGGVLVATAAIYVANYQPGELFEPFRRAATTPAAQLALASAAAFGVVDVGKRYMMQELSLPPQTYVPVMFFVVTLLVSPLAARVSWPAETRQDLPKFAAAGLIVAVGNHLVMLAFQLLPASIGSPIVNTQAVVAVLLGGVLLNEEAFRIRLVAAGLAVTGITLITLG